MAQLLRQRLAALGCDADALLALENSVETLELDPEASHVVAWLAEVAQLVKDAAATAPPVEAPPEPLAEADRAALQARLEQLAAQREVLTATLAAADSGAKRRADDGLDADADSSSSHAVTDAIAVRSQAAATDVSATPSSFSLSYSIVPSFSTYIRTCIYIMVCAWKQFHEAAAAMLHVVQSIQKAVGASFEAKKCMCLANDRSLLSSFLSVLDTNLICMCWCTQSRNVETSCGLTSNRSS